MTNFFKDNLKRLADKYTQKYIADKTGFSQSSINNYISKNSEPSIQFLVSLKDAFGIDLDDFLFSRYENNEVEDRSRYIGNYLVYYYNNSAYKGEIHTNIKNTLNYGVLSIIKKSDIDKNVIVYGSFYKDRVDAVKTLKQADNDFDYDSVYKLHSNEKNFYEGNIHANLNNLFISLSSKDKDDEVYFIFNNPPSSADYIGGLGTINSVCRGREHNPCVQYAIISRKLIDRPDGEIYNCLSLGYTEVDFDTPISELVNLFKRLYVDRSELTDNLTEDQKESIIENKLKYYFNEIVDANMFRFAKITNHEDDVVYRILKENIYE